MLENCALRLCPHSQVASCLYVVVGLVPTLLSRYPVIKLIHLSQKADPQQKNLTLFL